MSESARRRRSSGAVYIVAGVAAVGAAFLLGVLQRERRAVAPAALDGSSFDIPAVSDSGERAIAEAAKTPPPAQPIPAKPPMGVVAPIPLDGMEGARSRPSAVPAGKVPVITAKAVRWARTHKVFAAFLKAPARYLAGKGERMSSPRAFQAFLRDPKQVDAYLDSSLVRVALNSPVVVRALLQDSGVVRAFLGSPAMQDAATVRELLQSKLFKKVMDCPGPQGALEDPRTLSGAMSNPDTLAWLKENPTALKALSEAAPALAGAMPSAPKKKR
jgi:hypothetical protein